MKKKMKKIKMPKGPEYDVVAIDDFMPLDDKLWRALNKRKDEINKIFTSKEKTPEGFAALDKLVMDAFGEAVSLDFPLFEKREEPDG